MEKQQQDCVWTRKNLKHRKIRKVREESLGWVSHQRDPQGSLAPQHGTKTIPVYQTSDILDRDVSRQQVLTQQRVAKDWRGEWNSDNIRWHGRLVVPIPCWSESFSDLKGPNVNSRKCHFLIIGLFIDLKIICVCVYVWVCMSLQLRRQWPRIASHFTPNGFQRLNWGHQPWQ